MALELAGTLLDKLIHVEVRERARFVRHAVPGMDGDRLQDMGRHSTVVAFRGILYGPEAEARIKALRASHLAREPVDFLCEAVGHGYFAHVVIENLAVSQQAGYPGQFEFHCQVAECPPPADPAEAAALPKAEAGLRAEALAELDAAQASLVLAKGFERRLALSPDFFDPRARLSALLESLPDPGNTPWKEMPSLLKILEGRASGSGMEQSLPAARSLSAPLSNALESAAKQLSAFQDRISSLKSGNPPLLDPGHGPVPDLALQLQVGLRKATDPIAEALDALAAAMPDSPSLPMAGLVKAYQDALVLCGGETPPGPAVSNPESTRILEALENIPTQPACAALEAGLQALGTAAAGLEPAALLTAVASRYQSLGDLLAESLENVLLPACTDSIVPLTVEWESGKDVYQNADGLLEAAANSSEEVVTFLAKSLLAKTGDLRKLTGELASHSAPSVLEDILEDVRTLASELENFALRPLSAPLEEMLAAGLDAIRGIESDDPPDDARERTRQTQAAGSASGILERIQAKSAGIKSLVAPLRARMEALRDELGVLASNRPFQTLAQTLDQAVAALKAPGMRDSVLDSVLKGIGPLEDALSSASPEQALNALEERYAGLLDRMTGSDPETWATALRPLYRELVASLERRRTEAGGWTEPRLDEIVGELDPDWFLSRFLSGLREKAYLPSRRQLEALKPASLRETIAGHHHQVLNGFEAGTSQLKEKVGTALSAAIDAIDGALDGLKGGLETSENRLQAAFQEFDKMGVLRILQSLEAAVRALDRRVGEACLQAKRAIQALVRLAAGLRSREAA